MAWWIRGSISPRAMTRPEPQRHERRKKQTQGTAGRPHEFSLSLVPLRLRSMVIPAKAEIQDDKVLACSLDPRLSGATRQS